jgi:siroheme synthase-like protein
MLVDLQLQGKKSLAVIFNEREARIRLSQLIESRCSKIRMITSRPIAERIGNKYCGIKVIGTEFDSKYLLEILQRNISSFRPFLTVISTSLPTLDRKMANIARNFGSLVYVVDSPKLNDFDMPAVAKLGDVRVAISTGGKSPAMASILRQRIERNITKDDILQVKLQGLVRDKIKSFLLDADLRKKTIYRLLRDRKIRSLLKRDRFDDAVKATLQVIERSRNGGS